MIRIWGVVVALLAAPLYGVETTKELRAELKARALTYFVDLTNPATGLVRDRALNRRGEMPKHPDYRMASIAATGFGYAILAHAAKTGQLDYAKTEAQIYRGLKFSLEKFPHYKGWLFHFVHWETGARFGMSEVSTVDTSWFLAGVLYAGQVFGGRVAELANSLYRRVDFRDMMTHGGTFPDKRFLSMGWLPEVGYLSYQWNTYAEHQFLLLLGLGHPTQPLPPETWTALPRPLFGGVAGGDLSLFVHQYTQWFVNLKERRDAFGNYFQNSERATLADRAFCGGNKNYATYRAGYWGLSASGSPNGYSAFSAIFQNGTVCPSCVAGNFGWHGELVAKDLLGWLNGPDGKKLWGDYGFIDSLNLDRGWVDTDVIGISVAGAYFSIVNEESQDFWRVFEMIPPVALGLKRAGFQTSNGRNLLRLTKP